MEKVLLVFLVGAAVVSFPFSKFRGGITGKVVYGQTVGTNQSLNTEVFQYILDIYDKDFFENASEGTSICFQIKDNDEIYPYKLRGAQGLSYGNLGITCTEYKDKYQGIKNKEVDFIFTFTSYEYFKEFAENPGRDFFLQENITDKFQIWESDLMESGGLLIFNDLFRERYYDFFMSMFGMPICSNKVIDVDNIGTARIKFTDTVYNAEYSTIDSGDPLLSHFKIEEATK